ncbi:hypothetical protein HOK68_00230 [Candidatus Woesearchaeota archaeon]|jgi:ribosome-associated translation inhibitor RaiA|nr:hypothetical protein [Candidatus Woesearchaeota archaeon]MBT4387807.1 hypothetical protein [Candidatus Woesearchaeota archaeon]MBT4595626.1 hypothetical protein [Candidatus Woesearchaeota archaeon]MBT5740891.1 hypothetical protein [Candidatus Woesearchaeota archaeon]MBT6505188.1 hypothetical protein [Candidatus Woesearchaeota archaeon]
MIELGGNISLEGFKDVDNSEMTIIKKIVGNSTKKINDYCKSFEKFKVVLKNIHSTEGSKKFELNVSVLNAGQLTTSQVVDRNLFIGLSSAIRKIETQLNK